MPDLSQRTFGPSHKRLADLDDQELRREAQRRRARREGSTPPPPARGTPPPAPASRPAAMPPHVLQWYANLEIPVGSDLPTVEAAYQRLVRRYDPSRHGDDPDRHRTALELVRSLTRAYRGLAAYLRGEDVTAPDATPPR